MAFRLSAIALAAGLALSPSATAAVEPVQTFSADYSVSFLGFTVARSSFVTRLGADRYNVDGSIESAGLAIFFDDTRAKAAVSGRIGKDGEVVPVSYSVDYVYGKKAKKTSLSFAGGRVVGISNSPPLPRRRADWVPVSAKELQAVLDPISATLIRAKDLRSVCNHTAKAFDGELRADMTLSYVGTVPVSIDGFEGDAVTCSGWFKPVAGYHRGNKSLRFLSTRSRIAVTFAELGKTGIYAPIQASVSTRIGTVSIRARRLEATR
jgi:hypothetical protein